MVRAAAARISQGHLPADELVPVSRSGLTAVPALPEPAVHAVGPHRHVRRPRHGVPLVPLPVAGAVAAHRLLERPALRAEPLDGGRRRPRWRRSSPRPPASATRPRPTSGSATACGPSSGPSWTLPLAWGFTYRALSGAARSAFFAVLFIMLTVALHYETGYLAFVPLVVWPFIVPSDLWRRLGRAAGARRGGRAGVGLGHRPACSSSPTGRRATRFSRARGSRTATAPGRCCAWLFTGHLYDNDRFPPAPRLLPSSSGRRASASASARWRTFVAGRALVVIWVVTLVMSFGRTTFGSSTTSSRAAATSSSAASRWACSSRASCWPASALVFLGPARPAGRAATCSPRSAAAWATQPAGRGIVAGLCIVALIVVLFPAWSDLDTYDGHNATNIGLQAEADAAAGAADRPAAGLRARPPQGPRLRRGADQLGQRLPRRRRAGLQVPREQGHRRGRLHAAHGLAHDRPRVLLRRDQPGRLPALRHRLHHHARRHGVAGGGRQGRLLGRLLPVGAAPTPATSTSTTRPAC